VRYCGTDDLRYCGASAPWLCGTKELMCCGTVALKNCMTNVISMHSIAVYSGIIKRRTKKNCKGECELWHDF
jgi:hypothetical protein